MSENLNNFINNFLGPGGLLASGALLGAFITVLFNHIFESRRLKKERGFQLNKESYFRLEDKAECLVEGLYILKRRADEFAMQLHAFFDGKIKDLSSFENDFKKERIKLASNLHLFFSTTNLEKYNGLIKKHSQMGEISFNLYKNKTISAKELQDFDKLHDQFDGDMLELVEEIMKILEKEKRKIN